MKTLPHTTFGADHTKPTLYFGHANAYPPGAYKQLIEPLLDKHQVVSYLQRALWQPSPHINTIQSWHDLADDVIRFFDQQGLKNVIGVGHSLGAVTSFLAAQKRPDLFKALVMIESVVFSRAFCGLNALMPKYLKKKVPIINKALNRPDQWENKKQAFAFHRRARAFKRVSDAVLWDFIEDGVVPKGNHLTLRYPKIWEAKCYASVTYFRNQLLTSKLPILAFRGKHTDTVPADFWQKWQGNPNHQLVECADASHLLPLERPEWLTPQIKQFIEAQNQSQQHAA